MASIKIGYYDAMQPHIVTRCYCFRGTPDELTIKLESIPRTLHLTFAGLSLSTSITTAVMKVIDSKCSTHDLTRNPHSSKQSATPASLANVWLEVDPDGARVKTTVLVWRDLPRSQSWLSPSPSIVSASIDDLAGGRIDRSEDELSGRTRPRENDMFCVGFVNWSMSMVLVRRWRLRWLWRHFLWS